MDIPIQHCNDDILRAMRRRETKAGLHQLFAKLRSRIPGLVLRTTVITGLPYEDEAAFEELCGFLQEEKIQRAGAFPYSPEEGTPAAKMLNRVVATRPRARAELIMQLQSQVMDSSTKAAWAPPWRCCATALTPRPWPTRAAAGPKVPASTA